MAQGRSRASSSTGAAALVLAGAMLAAPVQAQPAPAGGIYTCTDANGRKLRSDRPIPACMDREQTILNPSGTVRERIGPTLTAPERAQAEARQRALEEERAQALEERRRNRALLIRYPSPDVHERERAKALTQLDDVVAAARQRIDALQQERRRNDAELEFYQGDVAKAPAALRRQIDQVAQNLEAQSRFIQAQEVERQRINTRFDEEQARLRGLWAAQARPASAPTRP